MQIVPRKGAINSLLQMWKLSKKIDPACRCSLEGKGSQRLLLIDLQRWKGKGTSRGDHKLHDSEICLRETATPFSKLWTLVTRSEEVASQRALISCASQNVPKCDKYRIYDCRRSCSGCWWFIATSKATEISLYTLITRLKTSFIAATRAARHWHLHN